jgi:hypothetical protein
MTRNGGRFLTTKHTKHTKGGGRGPETLPANYAEGREWRKGDSEEWPTEHTEYTERGGERWEPRKRKGAEFFTTKDAMGGGRGPETLPANYAEGREWRKGETEEWPTEHTEYTELGTRGGNRGNGRGRSLFNHEIHERGRAGTGEVARELREGTRRAERGIGRVAHGIHGIHGNGEGGGRGPETEGGKLA